MAPRSQENTEETVESPRPSGKDPLGEPPKPTSKIIRILTVFVYVLSVSLTAILLSIYYIFLWKGEPHLGANKGAAAMVNNEWEDVGGTEKHMNSMAEPSFERFQGLNYVEDISEETSTIFMATDNSINSTSFENIEENSTELYRHKREMQQQLTAVEVATLPKNLPISSTSERSITWLEEYDSLEELSRSSTFMQKIMENDNYQE